jgi:glucose/mannose-6-phosphate isomerase
MNILDSRKEIANIDKGNVLGSVEQLPDQCLDAWEQTRAIQVPKEYRDVDNIVLCGMGGSGLGARVIESLYAKDLKVPLVRVNGYDLPGFVNERSLVSCSSYSGSTEETIENAKQAIARHAKWMAIGTGGKLLELAKEHNVPFYQIKPTNNPSNQPRMAIGYSVVGQLALAKHAGVISMSKSDIDNVVEVMKTTILKNNVESPESNNTAKTLARQMKGKIIIYIASEHLIGAIHTVNNQQNENAKNISFDVQIPELNHHLMEGLTHPSANSGNVLFVFAFSNLYPPRIQKRFKITKQVVEKNGISTCSIQLTATNMLSQAFELIQLGAYANLYLSIIYGQNPAPIPWVDWFKEQMAG